MRTCHLLLKCERCTQCSTSLLIVPMSPVGMLELDSRAWQLIFGVSIMWQYEVWEIGEVIMSRRYIFFLFWLENRDSSIVNTMGAVSKTFLRKRINGCYKLEGIWRRGTHPTEKKKSSIEHNWLVHTSQPLQPHRERPQSFDFNRAWTHPNSAELSWNPTIERPRRYCENISLVYKVGWDLISWHLIVIDRCPCLTRLEGHAEAFLTCPFVLVQSKQRISSQIICDNSCMRRKHTRLSCAKKIHDNLVVRTPAGRDHGLSMQSSLFP